MPKRYPKQQKLLALKRVAVDGHAHRPAFLPLAQLSSLHPCKFDVILIDPQYTEVTWERLLELPIPALSGDPSFVFLWVGHGSSDGLERGRELLAKWGFRRCEDIVWVKTNKTTNRGPGVRMTFDLILVVSEIELYRLTRPLLVVCSRARPNIV